MVKSRLMDQKSRTIILGAAALLILGAVAGAIVYLTRAPARISNQAEAPIDLLSRLPTLNSVNPSPTPSLRQNVPTANFKSYAGSGFALNYPAEWGLLTCSNSQNFEFDPVNTTDTKGVICDRAVKPVTVLVVNGSLNCPTRSVTGASGEMDYQWCVPLRDNRFLDISHRVSQLGSQAASKKDYSAVLEQLITTIQN